MFSSVFLSDHIHSQVNQSLMATRVDVERVLSQTQFSVQDLPILLSPAAEPFIEVIAQKAHQLTIQRFGRVMQFFIPLYLSNECFNVCTYCGFSRTYDYQRKTLNDAEILREGQILKSKGFDHILLLTGESPKSVDSHYIAHAVSLLSPLFSSIGIEVQPLSVSDYRRVILSGADSLTLYQETYHPDAYKRYHLSGIKSRYANRLNAVDRGAQAGFYRINLGILMGLYDWRYDGLALASHVDYMLKTYWKSKYSVSFPRINPMGGSFKTPYGASDLSFVMLICAYRLVFPDIGITLSTRESPELRNHLIPLGVTQMSAESNTAPGGYTDSDTESQFEVSDHRSLTELTALLTQKGYDVVLKDWDVSFLRSA